MTAAGVTAATTSTAGVTTAATAASGALRAIGPALSDEDSISIVDLEFVVDAFENTGDGWLVLPCKETYDTVINQCCENNCKQNITDVFHGLCNASAIQNGIHLLECL